jgi:hypothetical protein
LAFRFTAMHIMGSSAQYLVHTNYDTSISIEPISKHIKKKWLPMQCPVKFKEELQTNVRKRNVISYAYPRGIKCVPGRHARIKASKKKSKSKYALQLFPNS